VLLTQSYNFITFCYFIGVSGFPSGIWLVAEVATECFTLMEWLIRIAFQKCHSAVWDEMWLIHDGKEKTRLYYF